ncbi:uncharacterized protein PFL1_03641 [Pseudozyma flocculosa PF-1]|uniref:JmjC domain-containing protein n=1 Tax=Pseudozyma flocculosa PF-1 TaxID=1277687 RepID=A0A061H870_9BASI|nr:uncharacterized protein PFL1_03641 [Pseudozyma flocculosa PF-1]EPQ28838.1 hypothetical protein PFL1_03641 [Pseudozyma flocculosa PF-1]
MTTADNADSTIPILDYTPSYDEFLTNHLLPNEPCLFSTPLDTFAPWLSRALSTAPLQEGTTSGRGWTTPSIDWDVLAQQFGDHVAPTVFCDDEGRQCREDLPVARTVAERMAAGKGPVYIKDWHLVRLARRDAMARSFRDRWSEVGREEREREMQRRMPYVVPEALRDDWMNPPYRPARTSSKDTKRGSAPVGIGQAPRPEAIAAADGSDNEDEDDDDDDDDDDFRFCYAGTAGSSTGIHRDVYTSYSWSTNLVGVKRWRLWAPSHAACLRRFPAVRTSELVHDYATMLTLVPPPSSSSTHERAGKVAIEWSGLPQAVAATRTVVQRPGETIFVPSDWYHQVENVTECISLNHNWCNAVNLPSLYRSIVEEVEDVQHSLDDVREMLSKGHPGAAQAAGPGHDEEWRREWTKIVLDVAKQDAGWAWTEFWRMVATNLGRPPALKQERPEDRWVRDRIWPLVADFEGREEFAWVEEECRTWWRKAKEQLDKESATPP